MPRYAFFPTSSESSNSQGRQRHSGTRPSTKRRRTTATEEPATEEAEPERTAATAPTAAPRTASAQPSSDDGEVLRISMRGIPDLSFEKDGEGWRQGAAAQDDEDGSMRDDEEQTDGKDGGLDGDGMIASSPEVLILSTRGALTLPFEMENDEEEEEHLTVSFKGKITFIDEQLETATRESGVRPAVS